LSKKALYIISLFFLLWTSNTNVYALDPQFTQFYAAPLYLNPAFAGAIDCWRAGANYRNQWSLGNTPYPTYKVFVDHNLSATTRFRGGAGLYIFRDDRGVGDYTTYEIAPMLSYFLRLNNTINLRFGLQPSYHLKYANGVGNLTFGDQMENLNGTVRGPSEGINKPGSYNFFDLSSGILLYSPNWWLGLSGHHLLRNRFMVDPNTNRVPLKVSIHGGYRYEIPSDIYTSLTTALNLRAQGKALQFDVGMYFERQKLVLGAWYRGMPLITGGGFNSDALAALVGLHINQWRVGYSYDFPLSKMSYTFGSHEISLIYEFCFYYSKRQRPPANVRKIPCPDW
jgi:type IX secretion system PorP/SprF family membrane protein